MLDHSTHKLFMVGTAVGLVAVMGATSSQLFPEAVNFGNQAVVKVLNSDMNSEIKAVAKASAANTATVQITNNNNTK